VVADPPTPFGVAIHLTDTRIHPDADCADERRLAEIGTEAGPEVVVNVRPSVECAGVKRQPMTNSIEECNEKGDSQHEKKRENEDS